VIWLRSFRAIRDTDVNRGNSLPSTGKAKTFLPRPCVISIAGRTNVSTSGAFALPDVRFAAEAI
jgi:hypothetical protein